MKSRAKMVPSIGVEARLESDAPRWLDIRPFGAPALRRVTRHLWGGGFGGKLLAFRSASPRGAKPRGGAGAAFIVTKAYRLPSTALLRFENPIHGEIDRRQHIGFIVRNNLTS